jgi:hypothetical protein
LPTTTWLLNQNVLQYSTIVRLVRDPSTSGNVVEIESLILFDMATGADTASWIPSYRSFFETKRCLVKFSRSTGNKNYELFLIKYDELVMIEDRIYRIKCLVRLNAELELISGQIINRVQVAIVDIKHYNNEQVEKELPAFNTIFFHRSNVIKNIESSCRNSSSRGKIKSATINCVHTVREINTEQKYRQTKNWLQINKLIGVDRVRFCRLVDNDNETDNNIQKLIKHFGGRFVEVTKYQSNTQNVCENLANIIKESKKWTSQCMERIEKTFDMFGIHEKMCANDCFQNYKHNYKYLTNYDIDEFIFPRQFNKNHFHELSERELTAVVLNFNKQKSNFSICGSGSLISDFIQRLVNLYGTRVAYFHFENFLVLNEHENLMDKINNNVLLSVNGGRTLYLDYENTERRTNMRFLIRNDSSWWPASGNSDTAYFQSFKNLSHYIKRLDKVYFLKEKNRLELKWRNVLMSIVSTFRPGKSIFNTDLVLGISPHNSMRIMPDTVRVRVPMDLGFVSHFRDEDISTKLNENQFAHVNNFPIRHLVLDMEYFLFLVSAYDKF